METIPNELKERKTNINDLEKIMDIYRRAIKTMNEKGINQWDNLYPSEEIIQKDIKKGQMFVALLDKRVVSVFVLNQECDEEYGNGDWKFEKSKFCIVHRLCVDPEIQGRGIGMKTMLLIEKLLRQKGAQSIRLDAFSLNPNAIRMYEGLEYKRVGTANWRKGLFYLYEKNIDI